MRPNSSTARGAALKASTLAKFLLRAAALDGDSSHQNGIVHTLHQRGLFFQVGDDSQVCGSVSQPRKVAPPLKSTRTRLSSFGLWVATSEATSVRSNSLFPLPVAPMHRPCGPMPPCADSLRSRYTGCPTSSSPIGTLRRCSACLPAHIPLAASSSMSPQPWIHEVVTAPARADRAVQVGTAILCQLSRDQQRCLSIDVIGHTSTSSPAAVTTCKSSPATRRFRLLPHAAQAAYAATRPRRDSS